MADTKLPALTALSALALDDLVYAVDVSDTTDHTSGSSRSLTALNLLKYTLHGHTEISITGATTATIGRMHVCSGTSADYTVTLPTAVGNAGQLISLRMSNSLTKLVTLDGNSTETIDGSLTRVMHDGESAVLMSDGANWFKIAGRSKPFYATMRRITSDVATSSGVSTKITLNEAYEDSLSLANTATGSITPKRTGKHIVSGQAGFKSMTGIAQTHIYINSSLRLFAKSYMVSELPAAYVQANITLNAGEAVELYARQDTGSINVEGNGSYLTTYLSILEVPNW